MIKNGTNSKVRFVLRLGAHMFGYSHEDIMREGGIYLERRVLWLGIISLRLHKFHAGDDGPMHDHPFWFVTLPLRTYYEDTIGRWELTDDLPTVRVWRRQTVKRKVTAFLPHFRSAFYRHKIHDPAKPFYTLVITGWRQRKWGFWPEPNHWVSYDKFGVEYDYKRKD